MKQYAGALNRGWLGVLGGIALLAGLYAVLAMRGLLPGPEQGSKVNADQVRTISDLTEVIVGVLALGVVVGLLAIVWLIAQIPRTNDAGPLRFQDDAARGLSLCDPDVVTRAVEDDITSLASVLSADAVMRGTAAAPELILRVGVDDRADIQALMQGLRSCVIGNFATAMGTSPSRLGLRIDVEKGKRSTDSITM